MKRFVRNRADPGHVINASGQVTAFLVRAGNRARLAFLWDGTTLQDLNALIDQPIPWRRLSLS